MDGFIAKQPLGAGAKLVGIAIVVLQPFLQRLMNRNAFPPRRAGWINTGGGEAAWQDAAAATRSGLPVWALGGAPGPSGATQGPGAESAAPPPSSGPPSTKIPPRGRRASSTPKKKTRGCPP